MYYLTSYGSQFTCEYIFIPTKWFQTFGEDDSIGTMPRSSNKISNCISIYIYNTLHILPGFFFWTQASILQCCLSEMSVKLKLVCSTRPIVFMCNCHCISEWSCGSFITCHSCNLREKLNFWWRIRSSGGGDWINSTSHPYLCSSLSTLAKRQLHLWEREKKRNAVTLACKYSDMPEMSNSKPSDCRTHWVSRLWELMICWCTSQMFQVPLEMFTNLL